MCVALIGGMDRLERDYETEARRHGVELRVFTKTKTGLTTRLKAVDVMVMFTGKVSHQLKREAVSAAKSKSIPVIMVHSCGVCSLRECLQRLVASGQRGAGESGCAGSRKDAHCRRTADRAVA
ncbi:MAG: DUF2325 domain-containing protein [Syntrophorhabdus sp.]|jgi:hypothetical protein|nr:DUF2325 domain-containing protein [Syntrophorhabdus sp.]